MNYKPRFILITAFVVSAFLQNSIAWAQAVRLADLNPGTTGSYPSNFTATVDSLIFGAYTQSTGFELWSYNGTSVQLVADINNTSDDIGGGIREGNDSLTAWLTPYNGNLYFSAYDPRRGAELWQFNGATVTRVADISPDLNDTIKMMPNSSWPSQLTVFNNSLYFSANSATTSTNYELWKYDGSTTSQVANIRADGPGDQSSYPSGFTVFNGALYFMANDGVNGYELWKHDGTNTVMLADINPGGAESGSFPKNFTALNGFLYFQAYSSATGFELWKTDGTLVSLAKDIYTGPESGSPNAFQVYNGALYFMATDGVSGYELWKFDGTTATLVSDINPAGDAYPKNFKIFQNHLYFVADDGLHGWELWKYDGTTATLVQDLNTIGDSFPEELTILDGKLYFAAETPETGREIWSYSGTSIELASDTNPGSGSSYPQFLTAFNNQLFFRAADDGLNDFEPWRLAPINGQPPSVSISSPLEGASFNIGQTITFTVNTGDDVGISSIEFIANGVSLGSMSSAPYTFSTTLPAGTYSITAKATDTSGLTTTSTPIQITVSSSNQAPSITLISEQTGSPGNVILRATATDSDGQIAKVDFYQGEALLGTSTTEPFQWTIANLAAGTYSFKAIATDNSGATQSSSTIQTTISESPAISSIQKSGNTLTITVTGPADQSIALEWTTDFQTWNLLQNQTSTNGVSTFTDSAVEPHRFYRAVLQ